MKRLTLAIALLAAGPALAQPPTDWTKPVTGVDAPSPVASEITEAYVIIADSYRTMVTPIAIESIIEASDTPLPPPCEPTPVRSGILPPEAPTPSPTPPPAPCRP